jgi:hypothetical protein
MLEPQAWAQRQFETLDLGDQRRNKRAMTIAAAMARQPGASLPRQMGDAHQAKAAYRFFDMSDQVTFESLASGHWQQTRAQMAQLDEVLLIQDTSEIDYSDHHDVSGLGPIGNGSGRGMLLHSVLAVDPAKGAQVQGVAWAELFYRQLTDQHETRKQRVERQDRQSQVWVRAVRACGTAAALGKRFTHICDCGSDDFGFFGACLDVGSDFLSRIYQPRKAVLGHDAAEAAEDDLDLDPRAARATRATAVSLLDLARALPALGGKTLTLRSRKGITHKVKKPGKRHASTCRRPHVPARCVQLLVSASPVTVLVPAHDQRHQRRPLKLWVVRVWEPNPIAGQEPIEWILLSSRPVNDLADALQMAQWYSYRWLIEEYHKCLKTGCRIEQRQLQSSDRLEAMLGIATLLAARLLAIKQQAMERPDAPAIGVVGALAVKLLIAQRKLRVAPAALSVYQFWRAVAQLGGFLARKRDGEPGWQTLWLGWQELQMMVRGAQMLQHLETQTKNCG